MQTVCNFEEDLEVFQILFRLLYMIEGIVLLHICVVDLIIIIDLIIFQLNNIS